MNPYNYPEQNHQTMSSMALDTKVSQVMKRVYLKMFLALVVTGLTSWFVAGNVSLQHLVYGGKINYFIWVIIEFGLVIWISAGLNKMKASTATILFYLFSIVNGLMLSGIFIAYSLPSLAKTFFITAGTFGAMSVYGYFTNKDLTRWGSFLFMALIGLIICSVVNIFWNNGTLGWIISIAGVLIFLGLTAWDTQKIKQMALYAPEDSQTLGKLATIGALSLYLDFINLFLFLLRFFGNGRD